VDDANRIAWEESGPLRQLDVARSLARLEALYDGVANLGRPVAIADAANDARYSQG
jgi:hypothetical protein